MQKLYLWVFPIAFSFLSPPMATPILHDLHENLKDRARRLNLAVISLLRFSFFEDSYYNEGSSRWFFPVGLMEPSHFGQPPCLVACHSMVPSWTRR